MVDENPVAGLEHQIPDEVWEQIEPLLPLPKPKKKPGRPRMGDRKAMAAILYVLRTGCPWKALPSSLGAPTTVHDRFQEWRGAGVFEHMYQAGLLGERGTVLDREGVIANLIQRTEVEEDQHTDY